MTPTIEAPPVAEDEIAREPRALPYLFEIAPYVGGESKIAGANRVIRLASNESALGPSPKAMAAYREAAAGIYRYPDGASTDLRAAIARHFDIDAARVVCGTGSDELIGLLARCYAGPGDEVLYSRHGFLMYPIAAQAAGAMPVAAQETDLTCDVDSMLALVGPRTKLVYLANPNNPTGTYLPAEEVRRLHRGLPASTVLVLDAAYSEFVSAGDYESGLELAKSEANVVMLRTFSKIHALAGLRVGWCYGSAAVADILNRVRGTFNVALPAQAAAIASLADTVALDRARAHNERWRPWLASRLRALGLEVTPGVANFVLVRFGYPPRDPHAAFEFLRTRFILTRKVAAYHLPEHLRITIGTEEENRAVAAALADFMTAP